jgi:RNA polymerase sigma-70 factor (ECF subfamily)
MEKDPLLQRLINGDEIAFEVLYYRYRGKVGNFIRKFLPSHIDLEETVHEIFLRIWINKEKIDANRPFEPYLFKIARNLIVDELRKNIDRLIYICDKPTTCEPATNNNAESKIEEKELQDWLNTALKQLPEKRRKIFLMSRVEDLSYKEIASKLGITENTVDTQIRRTLSFLREEIKKLNFFITLL